jgi:hypothetical protein
MQQIDITQVAEFTRGVARFTRIAQDAKTGVQAWRRSYPLEAWRDRVEFFTPQAGKYYPDDSRIMRRVPANDPKLREKVDFYLEHGLAVWFEGDEKKSIFEEETNQD